MFYPVAYVWVVFEHGADNSYFFYACTNISFRILQGSTLMYHTRVHLNVSAERKTWHP